MPKSNLFFFADGKRLALGITQSPLCIG